jgi:hypothetical protein
MWPRNWMPKLVPGTDPMREGRRHWRRRPPPSASGWVQRIPTNFSEECRLHGAEYLAYRDPRQAEENAGEELVDGWMSGRAQPLHAPP